VLVHDGGGSLDTRSLSVVVEVDGEPLTHQPPVPFFSASGFEPGPTGVFNVGYSGEWEVGDSAGFTLNPNTNGPAPERGSAVSVEVYEGDRPITRAETTAR
jgi:archaeal type IV pilus assembly protein PilA